MSWILAMKVAISALTGELVSRFISFLMNKYNSFSHAWSEEEKAVEVTESSIKAARTRTQNYNIVFWIKHCVWSDVFWVKFGSLNLKNTVMKLYVMTIIAIHALIWMILRCVLCRDCVCAASIQNDHKFDFTPLTIGHRVGAATVSGVKFYSTNFTPTSTPLTFRGSVRNALSMQISEVLRKTCCFYI